RPAVPTRSAHTAWAWRSRQRGLQKRSGRLCPPYNSEDEMDVLMPQLGETVAEGKITKWFKAAGDKVAPGDNLFEIETDKTSMEVPATEAGILAEVRVAAGESALVGAVVAVISDGSAPVKSAPAQTPAPAAPSRAAAAPAAAAQVSAAVAATPAPPRPIALDPFREVRSPERNF